MIGSLCPLFGVWLYLSITGIQAYIRISKVKGMPRFMTRKELANLQDPIAIAAVNKCRRNTWKLLLLWLLTVLGFVLLSAIINNTIGFND